MYKVAYSLIFAVLLFTACNKDEVTEHEVDNGTPIVKIDSTYTVLKEEDITYAEGLSHDETSTSVTGFFEIFFFKFSNSKINLSIFISPFENFKLLRFFM